MNRGIFLAAALLLSAAGPPNPVRIIRNSSVLEFSYEWPAQAAAIPALARKFRAQMTAAYADALPLARANHADYQKQGRGSVRDLYSMKWTAAGQSSRLLSLQSQESTYTGGAHPNTAYGALLWDRTLGHEIGTAALFLRPSALPELTRPGYCARLDRERLKRRNGEVMGLPEFDDCPAYSLLAIAPVDADRDGRFDAIDFVASPYTAGPYAEGEYSVTIPVTPKLIAALKLEYRSSFEAQRQ